MPHWCIDTRRRCLGSNISIIDKEGASELGEPEYPSMMTSVPPDDFDDDDDYHTTTKTRKTATNTADYLVPLLLLPVSVLLPLLPLLY